MDYRRARAPAARGRGGVQRGAQRGGGGTKSESFQGVVEKINDGGLKLDGIVGWFNVGNYPPKGDPFEDVDVGMNVAIRASPAPNGGYYLNGLDILDPDDQLDHPAPAPAPTPAPPVAGYARAPGAPTETDLRIARAVALKAAVELGVAGGTEETRSSAAVVAVAAKVFLPFLLTGALPPAQQGPTNRVPAGALVAPSATPAQMQTIRDLVRELASVKMQGVIDPEPYFAGAVTGIAAERVIQDLQLAIDEWRAALGGAEEEPR